MPPLDHVGIEPVGAQIEEDTQLDDAKPPPEFADAQNAPTDVEDTEGTTDDSMLPLESGGGNKSVSTNHQTYPGVGVPASTSANVQSQSFVAGAKRYSTAAKLARFCSCTTETQRDTFPPAQSSSRGEMPSPTIPCCQVCLDTHSTSCTTRW